MNPLSSSKNKIVIVLSAKDSDRLRVQADNLLRALAKPEYTEATLESIAYTLQVGRDAMTQRLAFTVDSIVSLKMKLTNFIDLGEKADDIFYGTVLSKKELSKAFGNNQTIKEKVNEHQQKEQLNEILNLWVYGHSLDWDLFYDERRPKRISLPTYAFSPDRFWVTDQEHAKNRLNNPQLHPLLHLNISDTTGSRFSSCFTGGEFFLQDHQISNERTLPGVAYLEMARAAWENFEGSMEESSAVYIKNIGWSSPIIVGKYSKTVYLSLTQKADNQVTFDIYSESEVADELSLVTHCSGQVGVRPTTTVPQLDIEKVKLQCGSHILSSSDCYKAFKAMGLDYGIAHQSIENIFVGKSQLLAKLKLPSSISSTRYQFILHPSLMDGALQACIGFVLGHESSGDLENKPSLPFALDELEIYKQGKPVLWAVIQRSEGSRADDSIQKMDIGLYDERGDLCVLMRRFSMRVLQSHHGAIEPLTNVNLLPVRHNTGPLVDTQDKEDPNDNLSSIEDGTLDYLKTQIALVIGVPSSRLSVDESMETYGINSIMVMKFTKQLETVFGSLSKTLFFEYQTIRELAGYFIENHRDQLTDLLKLSNSRGDVDNISTPISVSKEHELDSGLPRHSNNSANHNLNSHLSCIPNSESGLDIAIIGLSGRYPKAENLEIFWENLRDGLDCITDIPKDRWDWSDYPKIEDLEFSNWGGFIEGADEFDPLFFNISPREAESMDPQERIFLQTAWHTVEEAGYSREMLKDYKVGVFVGVMYGEYQLVGPSYAGGGASYASIANRASYFLDAKGPSLALDTMCSSALTAIHTACQNIQLNECQMALAGGVNLSIHPKKYVTLSVMKFTSSEGKCRSFGEGGDGYVPGEGVGAVLLKPLQLAEQDGDLIYGVIKSSSHNHGGKTNGYTVPNPIAQGDLIRRNIEKSGLEPESIGYFEAHGTGTSLGDPIEIAGLTRAFQSNNLSVKSCAIGSVKSNVGHLESAAGIVALSKVLLQMKYRQLVPSIHSTNLNQNINWEKSPFYVQQNLESWTAQESSSGLYPLRASISSFGAGGSNAHLVIEEHSGSPMPEDNDLNDSHSFVFVLSAKDNERLNEYVELYIDFLQKVTNVSDKEGFEGQVLGGLVSLFSETYSIEEKDVDVKQPFLDMGWDLTDLSMFVSKACGKYNLDSLDLTYDELLRLDDLASLIVVHSLQATSDKHIDIPYPQNEDYTLKAVNVGAICYSSQICRESFDQRLAVVVSSIEELLDCLSKIKSGYALQGNVYRGGLSNIIQDTDNLLDGDAGQDFLVALLKQAELNKLAQLWVNGANFSWRALAHKKQYQRVRLPTYPYAKERYWVSSEGSDVELSGKQKRDIQVKTEGDGLDSLFYTARWFNTPLEKLNKAASTVHLRVILIVTPELHHPLVNEIRSQHDTLNVYMFVLGSVTRIIAENTWEINAGSVAGLTQGLSLIPQPNTLYFLGSHHESMTGDVLIERYNAEFEQGIVNFFRLIKAVIEELGRHAQLDLKVVTCNATNLHDETNNHPMSATLHGFVQSLAKEYPNWEVSLIDVSREDIESARFNLSRSIVAEPGLLGTLVIFREGQRYLQKLLPATLPPIDKQIFKMRGVYLIVGGASGIGLALADFLSSNFSANLILLGRRPSSVALQRRFQTIEQCGGQVCYVQADITDETELKEALRPAKERFGQIQGVIHSAIVLKDMLIDEMDESNLREVLAPKVQGSLVLHKVLRAEPIDFLLFLSSLQSYISNPSQSNYAAGCTFVDAFAHQLNQSENFPVKVINWGYWGSVGVVATEEYRNKMASIGMGSIEPQEGMEVIERVVNQSFQRIFAFKASDDLRDIIGVDVERRAQSYENSLPRVAIKPPVISLDASSRDELAILVNNFSTLERWCELSLLTVLQSMGIFREPNERFNVSQLLTKLAILPSYNRLFTELLNILVRASYLQRDGSDYISRSIINSAALRQEQAKTATQEDVLAKQDSTAPYIKLAKACIDQYPKILTGQIHHMEVMFPNGSAELVEGAYKGNLITDYFNNLVALSIEEYVAKRLLADPHQIIKILEVGAGTGGTSEAVIDKLAPFGRSISYHYSDISSSFVELGESRFGHQAFVKYQILDIESPLEQQGWTPNDFDIIFATNVIHATSNIDHSLQQIKQLLKKGGLVVLNELTSQNHISTVTFGITEGWWLSNDRHMRLPGSPLLTIDTWRQALFANKYSDFTILSPSNSGDSGQHVMAARSDGEVILRAEPDVDAHSTIEPIDYDQGVNLSSAGKELGKLNRGELIEATQLDVLGIMGAILKIPQHKINIRTNIADYGFDSISLMKFSGELNKHYQVELKPTHFFSVKTLKDLIDVLVDKFFKELTAFYGFSVAETASLESVELTDVSEALPLDKLATGPTTIEKNNVSEKQQETHIAIIGVAGILPAANTLDDFWDVLRKGESTPTKVPAFRWGDCDTELNTGLDQMWGSFLDQFNQFDPLFFSMTPVEATYIDPQERLFLQSCWNAIEDAGYQPGNLVPSEDRNVGVYVGVTTPTHNLVGFEKRKQQPLSATGLSFGSIANRVSYFFDFHGPCMPVDTMCSSSLVAIQMACESINDGHCSMAIAGGVNLYLHPSRIEDLAIGGLLSEDQHTRSFSADGKGFVPCEAVGAAVLKPLSDAYRDGDNIHAVIRGGAIRHSGRTNAYFSPNPKAQASLIKQALADARLSAQDIDYVEAQGVGSELIDAIELEGLDLAYGQLVNRNNKLKVGTLKPNIGHAEAASGMTQLWKILLQFKHRTLYKTLTYSEPCRHFDFQGSSLEIQRENGVWGTEIGTPMRAAISGYGAGGTGAHLILESVASLPRPSTASVEPQLILLSAINNDRLTVLVERFVAHFELQQSPESERAEVQSLHSISETLRYGRKHFSHRLAIVAKDKSILLNELKRVLAGELSKNVFIGVLEDNKVSQIDLNLNLDASSMSQLHLQAQRWVRGDILEEIKGVKTSYAKVRLPGYPFEPRICWAGNDKKTVTDKTTVTPSLKQQVVPETVHANLPEEGASLKAAPLGGYDFNLERLNGLQSLDENLRQALAVVILRYFQQKEIFVDNTGYRFEQLYELCQINPPKIKLFNYFIEYLKSEQFIVLESDYCLYASNALQPQVKDKVNNLGSWVELNSRALPDYEPFFRYILLCSEQFDAIFQGRVSAESLLGSRFEKLVSNSHRWWSRWTGKLIQKRFKKAYLNERTAGHGAVTRSPNAYLYALIAGENRATGALSSLIQDCLELHCFDTSSATNVLRVLEIGAGPLDLAAAINKGLEVEDQSKLTIEYYFTEQHPILANVKLNMGHAIYKRINFHILKTGDLMSVLANEQFDIVILRPGASINGDASYDNANLLKHLKLGTHEKSLIMVNQLINRDLFTLTLGMVNDEYIYNMAEAEESANFIIEGLVSDLYQAERYFAPWLSILSKNSAALGAAEDRENNAEKEYVVSTRHFLLECFQNVLGFDHADIGFETDLRTLGISSILLAVIFAKISERYGSAIKVQQLSECYSIVSLAVAIDTLILNPIHDTEPKQLAKNSNTSAFIAKGIVDKVESGGQLLAETAFQRNEFKTRRGQVIEFYQCGVDTEKPPILFLTALAFTKSIWEYQIRDLAKDYRLIFPHLPGHAGSEFNGEAFSFDDLADDLVDVLDYLKIPSVHLAGWCMAGNIAQIMALKYGSRLRSLSLICTTPTDVRTRGLSGADLSDYSANPLATYELEFQNIYREQYFNNSEIADYLTLLEKSSTSVDLGSLTFLIKNLYEFDTRNRLKFISLPTFVVSGSKDIAFPPEQVELLKQGIPNAEFYEFKDGGHLPFVNQHHLFNEKLRLFLARVEQQSRPITEKVVNDTDCVN